MAVSGLTAHVHCLVGLGMLPVAAAHGSLQVNVSTFRYVGVIIGIGRTCCCKGAVELVRCAAIKSMWSVVKQAHQCDTQHISLLVMLLKLNGEVVAVGTCGDVIGA